MDVKISSFLQTLRKYKREGYMGKRFIRENSNGENRLFFENGAPLLFYSCYLRHIRELGGGRCDCRGNELYFSRLGNGPVHLFWPLVQSCPAQSALGRANSRFIAEKIVQPEQKEALAMFADLVAADNAKAEILHNREPHLLLFTHALVSGGAERQWCYLAKELAARGYKTTLLTQTLQGHGGHYLPLLSDTNVNICSLDTLRLPHDLPGIELAPEKHEDVVKLALAIRHLAPTHLLCQLDRSNLWGASAALLANCDVQKILFSFRNVNPTHFPHFPFEGMLEWYQVLLNSKRLVLSGNSRAGNADYAKWLGIEQKQVAYIPNAVLLAKEQDDGENITTYEADDSRRDVVRAALRRKLGISETAPVLLGVFRLSKEKRPLLFLRTVHKLKRLYPELVALHAGAGPLLEEARAYALELGIVSSVQFLGVRKDVPDLMRATDILLLCSEHEGLPNVLLEAQTMELSVVASRVGGVGDAVQEGVSALLAEVNDEDALFAACAKLLGDPGLRYQMGRAGRRFVLSNFTSQKLGKRTLDLLGLPAAPPESFVVAAKAASFDSSKFKSGSQAEKTEIEQGVKKDYLLADLVPQQTLLQYMQGVTAPRLCILTSGSILELTLQLPENCFCLALQTQLAGGKIHYCNLGKKRDRDALQASLKPETLAFMLSARTPSPNLRKVLAATGIKEMLVYENGAIYRLSTMLPSFWQRLCNAIKLLVH